MCYFLFSMSIKIKNTKMAAKWQNLLLREFVKNTGTFSPSTEHKKCVSLIYFYQKSVKMSSCEQLFLVNVPSKVTAWRVNSHEVMNLLYKF